MVCTPVLDLIKNLIQNSPKKPVGFNPHFLFLFDIHTKKYKNSWFYPATDIQTPIRIVFSHAHITHETEWTQPFGSDFLIGDIWEPDGYREDTCGKDHTCCCQIRNHRIFLQVVLQSFLYHSPLLQILHIVRQLFCSGCSY